MEAITGVGIDMVDVRRFENLISRRGERFLRRVFTREERDYCDSRPRPAAHYAGRFAVKEAVMKVLRRGFGQDGMAFSDIEVRRGPYGEVSVSLGGAAKAVAAEVGVSRCLVSLSHTDAHAVGIATGVGAA